MTADPLESFTQPRAVPGYAGNKRDHLTRLAKVEGQVRGIAHMVDEDRLHRRSHPGRRGHEGPAADRPRAARRPLTALRVGCGTFIG